MPRLVGKPSNSGTYVALLLLAAVGVAGVVEYTGVVNAVPGFGRDYLGTPTSSGEPGLSPRALPSPQSTKGQPDTSINGSPQ